MAFLNQANVAAVKTVLVEGDRYLPVVIRWHAMAEPWLPGDERVAPIMTAILRVADPCLAMCENYALLTHTGGIERVRLALQGSCWWRQGEKDKAVQAWRQTRVESFLYNWAWYDQAQGHVGRALDEYEMLLSVNPASMGGWLGLGGLYERLADWQQADQAYEEAIRVAPNNIMAYLEFAHFRFRRDQLDQRTVEAMEKAISLATMMPLKSVDLATLNMDLALAYIRTGHLLLAEEAARNAISLNPDLQIAYLYLGDALRIQGDNWGAISQYKKAITLGETNSYLYYGLAAAYLQVGDVTNAREEVEHLATVSPQHPGLQGLLDELEKLDANP
jgi:tetratricopeptide (TPR) repeat protein